MLFTNKVFVVVVIIMIQKGYKRHDTILITSAIYIKWSILTKQIPQYIHMWNYVRQESLKTLKHFILIKFKLKKHIWRNCNGNSCHKISHYEVVLIFLNSVQQREREGDDDNWTNQRPIWRFLLILRSFATLKTNKKKSKCT